MKKNIVFKWIVGAILLTLGMGIFAITSLFKNNILEYILVPFLWPGSMMGWLIKGDNFNSEKEFLAYGIFFSSILNAIFGALLGMLNLRIRKG